MGCCCAHEHGDKGDSAESRSGGVSTSGGVSASGGVMSRRMFGGLAATAVATTSLPAKGAVAADPNVTWDPKAPRKIRGKTLRVQPILVYRLQPRRPQTSWRSWSNINNAEAVEQEAARIDSELARLKKEAGFDVEFLPVQKVASETDLRALKSSAFDALLVYPATGGGNLLQACFRAAGNKPIVLFARHQNGPTYYWYEALNTRHLKKNTDPTWRKNTAGGPIAPTVDDVAIDDYGEVAWRLRALYGLHNTIGARVMSLGGVWGKYDDKAPQVAKDRYKLDLVEVPYADVVARFKAAEKAGKLRGTAEKWTDTFLAQPGTTLDAKRDCVVRAFMEYAVIKQVLEELDCAAFTIRNCMNEAWTEFQTTPCMIIGWLADEGIPAFCEADFVVVPAGILLHYIAGTPVFLHNSTFPHDGMVTCAHCAAPRRMDGTNYEPLKVVTHYESDYGAAPKVDMKVGQKVTFIDPEYSLPRWVGMTGTIKANPFYEICRTQQEVAVDGDWRALLNEVRDSHWVMAYGDHLKEIAYAARKIGVDYVDISTT